MNKLKQAKKERNKKDKEFRQFCLERDNFQCVMCERKGLLNVHHILPKEQYPENRHAIWNGLSLCFTHHMGGRQSPHRDSIAFVSWLIINKPELLDFLIDKVDRHEDIIKTNDCHASPSVCERNKGTSKGISKSKKIAISSILSEIGKEDKKTEEK